MKAIVRILPVYRSTRVRSLVGEGKRGRGRSRGENESREKT